MPKPFWSNEQEPPGGFGAYSAAVNPPSKQEKPPKQKARLAPLSYIYIARALYPHLNPFSAEFAVQANHDLIASRLYREMSK